MITANLQDLRYFAAVAEHLHFGRAAEACHVTQPTLSGQISKLEEQLGVRLFERTNKRVALTPIAEQMLPHARRALEEANAIQMIAVSASDPLAGPLKLGVIPTLAPYLMPLLLQPMRARYPKLTLELWEDVTHSLIELLRAQRLDAALIATEVAGGDLQTVELFCEPFLSVVPRSHALARHNRISEAELAPDLLVLADAHCMAAQSLAACGSDRRNLGSLQAASLETLVGMVESGYGTTLVPSLAASAFRARKVVLRPLNGHASRTVLLASRKTFPRQEAIRVLEQMTRSVVKGRWQRTR
jgi:LysR family transcriptional regulator, hydrogen peroxide-inducible genes activator